MNSKIDTINIIIPFKNINNKKLNKTINSLLKLSSFIKVNLILVYDFKVSRNISNIKAKFEKHKYSNFIFRAISTKKRGIYNAINIGLDAIDPYSYYCVLGEGDLIKNKKNFLNLKKFKIILIDYELSSGNINKKLRNIHVGMPYCHNAIIFKNNGLKYNPNYKISSDYEYFIKYLQKESINFKSIKDYLVNDFIYTIFESNQGISSKSKFTKYYENFLITIQNYGISGLFSFLCIYLKKISKLTVDL